MPRIKRWFPVSHDINSDAEVWAMRRQIGEKSLSIWLEILSISDRNESELPGDYEELIRSIAGKCQATVRTVSAVFDYAKSRLWLNSQPTLRTSNHWKYHRLQEQNKTPTGNRKSSLPSEPSEPSLLKNKISSELWQEEDYWLRDLLIEQAWLSSNGALHDPAWWEALSTELNGISPEWLQQQLAKMQAWCIENPKRKPTKKGVKRFVRSWLEKSAEERRRNASQQRR